MKYSILFGVRLRMPGKGTRQQGSVLILVLAMVSVLSWGALQAVRTARGNTASAGVARQSEQGRLLLFSAMQLAVATLEADPVILDSQHEPWNDFSSFIKEMEYNNGALQATISDAHARMNLNELAGVETLTDPVAQLAMRLLTYVNPKISSVQAGAFVWRCKDWTDQNSVEAKLGRVEHEVYSPEREQSQPLNRPFWSMEEVAVAMRGTPFYPLVNSVTFSRVFTVHMKSKININTASAEVLRALFANAETGRRFADSVIAFRKDARNALTEGWVASLDNGSYMAELPVSLITTRSSAFFMDASVPVGFGRKGRRVQLVRESSAVRPVFIEPLDVVTLIDSSLPEEGADSAGN